MRKEDIFWDWQLYDSQADYDRQWSRVGGEGFTSKEACIANAKEGCKLMDKGPGYHPILKIQSSDREEILVRKVSFDREIRVSLSKHE